VVNSVTPNPRFNFGLDISGRLGSHENSKMAPSKNRREKREAYRAALQKEKVVELPRKKFYRQRAHANPFSDHSLV